MKLEAIQKIVKETLSEKRYNHSLCVMERCEELARIYNVDIEQARLVGIAHDVAKEMSDEEKMEYIKNYNIEVDDIEMTNKGLLHAKIGADICKKRFGFTEEMIQAVAEHTTGNECMTILSKVLFVADATGRDRKWTDLEYARELSEKDIDKVVLYILDLNIKENIEKGKLIHENSIKARNYLIKIM